MNVPYRRNPLFTGREKLLTHLHENLTTSKAAMLTQPWVKTRERPDEIRSPGDTHMPDAGNILLICIFSSVLSARRRTLSKKSKTDHALLLDKTALIKSRQPLDEK